MGRLCCFNWLRGLVLALQPKNPNDFGVDRRRTYTSRFGGTSAAATQIAGAVRLQGLAKQYFQYSGQSQQGLRDIALKPYPAEGAPNTEAVIFDNSPRQNFAGSLGHFGL